MIKEKIKENILPNDSVLDMGTGSGILALEATKYAKKVTACDINDKVINQLKKIKVVKSNLFSNIKTKFDLIIFNPPYLPLDKNEPKQSQLATTGGKKGHETIERFINQADNYLKKNGRILLLFSSLTNKNKIDEIIQNNLFDTKLVASTNLFFEELYVYLITRSDFLKELKDRKISNIKLFTKGHRGKIYTGKFKNKKIAIKKQRNDIKTNTIENEINFLKKLNKIKIGPKLLFNSKSYFGYNFIYGKFIEQYFEKENKKKILKVINNIIDKCFILDKLLINKEEMHNPFKHIIINKNIKLIDFERCSYTNKPKNVTQFCQYLCKFKKILENKKIRFNIENVRKAAKAYKENINKDNLGKIKWHFGI